VVVILAKLTPLEFHQVWEASSFPLQNFGSGKEVSMKLLTKELLAQFEKAGRQENVPDPLVIAKFFNPTGAGTWYATEYYPEEKMFFGYVSIFGDWNDEWGYFTLSELESYKGQLGLGIERDLHFTPKPFSEIKGGGL